MQIKHDEIFFFGSHFAPIMDLAVYDTPRKRFGYVLSVMRRAKGVSQEALEPKVLPESKRGGTTISNWETGKTEPTSEELNSICNALELCAEDSHYLRNLLFGVSNVYDLSDSDKEAAKAQFEKLKTEDHPTLLRDHFWTVLDYSRGIQTRLALRREEAEKIVGTNLLSLLFDPKFNSLKAVFHGEVDSWQKVSSEQISRFRQSTSHLRYLEKYMHILFELSRNGWRFEELWYATPLEVHYHQSSKVPSKSLAFNTEFRDIRFVGWASVRISQWVVGK